VHRARARPSIRAPASRRSRWSSCGSRCLASAFIFWRRATATTARTARL